MKGPNHRLTTATLPIMPETSRELRRLLGLPSTRNRQLQEVLLGDPAAVIAVFRELNRARPGAGEMATDAAHALSLTGLGPFRRLLDSLPKVEPGKRDHTGMQGRESAYSQAAHAAFYANALSTHKGMTGNQEIPTAALLQNPAILALWCVEPESALRAANAVRDGVPTNMAFGAELGEPLEDVNQRLARAWAFPRAAQQAMGDWDDFNPRPQMIKLADGLAQTTAASWQHEDSETFTELLSEFLDLSPERATAWLHRQATDAARSLSRYGYPLPGFELIFTGREPEGQDDEDDHAIPVFGAPRPRQPPPREPAPAGDLHSTMADVMRRIREQTGSARVIFAMLNHDRSRLRTRLALGGKPEDGLRRLDLDLAQRNLFTGLMGKPQSLWLNTENAGRYLDHLPASLRRMLGSQGAYMMSLFVRDKPLGLLYGDGASLSEQGYRQFRELCLEAGAILAGGQRNLT
ncbi:MAG: HDOD domain-containing protein [Sedimenticolaceae bacterium]